MQLPIQSQSRIYAEPWEEGTGRRRAGHGRRTPPRPPASSTWPCATTSPCPEEPAERMQTIWYDTVATLAWIAGRTERLRLLSHVFVPAYRHPLVSAKALPHPRRALGRAHHPGRRHRPRGGRVRRPRRRLRQPGRGHRRVHRRAPGRLHRRVPDATRASTSPSTGVGLRPRPRQDVLPIWVGGSSKPALRRAAARGDGWLPQGTPRHELAGAIAYLLEHRQAARGDDPIDLGTICEPLYVGEPDWDVGPWTISGPAEQVAETHPRVQGPRRQPRPGPPPQPHAGRALRPARRPRPRRAARC